MAGSAGRNWARGIPKYDDSGLPIHYTGLFLDITERKGAEQVLRNFEKLSAAARLSAAIAHEINNPLSAVTNLIYLAKEGPGVPAAIVKQLVQAEQELERVAHAARQALGFYRESSRAERIDIPELMESVLKVFSTRIAGKKIKVVRGFLEVRASVRRAGRNQAGGFKPSGKRNRSGEGGRHHLPGNAAGGFRRERAIQFIVADDGHGIASEHRDHIFEPFFTTKAGTGTGLGLRVAKEIIERHRGSIEVQHTDSGSDRRGTTFTVRLPGESGAGVANPPIDPGKSVKRADLSESLGEGKAG